jgi:hypothetical protein
MRQDGLRSFTVSATLESNANPDDLGGVYVSKTPIAAAKKAARQLFNKLNAKDNKITFFLRETTRGSNKKVYNYDAQRKKLDDVSIMIDGKEVKINWEYKVKKSTVACSV